MSFTFIYDINSKASLEDGLVKSSEFSYRLAGDIFNEDITIQNIYSSIKNGKDLNLEGEFNLLINDAKSVVFLNDELGCIKWFYSLNKEKLIISNDFWSIIKEERLTTADVNQEALYEILMLGMPLENKTWINNIQVFPRGVKASFDKQSSKLIIEEKNSIHYTESLDDEKIAYADIEKALKKTVDKIVKLNPNKTFLFSTSGGLDSRFPLLYSESFENKSSFLIGSNDGIGMAYDYKNAKMLTNRYSLNLDLVDPFSQRLENKAKLDIIRNPIGHGNLLKALDVNNFIENPTNTILITGAHGGLIGGRKMNSILLNSKSDKELATNMFYSYSLIKELNNYKRTKTQKLLLNVKKLFALIIGREASSVNVPIVSEVKRFIETAPLIPTSNRKKMLTKFTNYFESNKGSNLTKIMRYHLLRHSIRGMFESMLGQLKSYTIYTYYIYTISKQWSVRFLYDRYIMQSFLNFKDSFSSKVSLQTYKPSVGVRSNIFSTLLRLVTLKTRKLVINYHSWWNHDDVKYFVQETMKKKTTFYQFFPEEEVYEYLFYNSDYSQTKETLVKLKLMIDYLEELQEKDYTDPYISNRKY